MGRVYCTKCDHEIIDCECWAQIDVDVFCKAASAWADLRLILIEMAEGERIGGHIIAPRCRVSRRCGRGPDFIYGEFEHAEEERSA